MKENKIYIMKYTEYQISEAIEKVKSLNLASIVREFAGYIIMAQSDNDLEAKKKKIYRGDVYGFYTIEKALNIKTKL